MNESKKRMMNDGKGLEQERKKLAQQADSHKKEVGGWVGGWAAHRLMPRLWTLLPDVVG
jgi:hypothetical protein